MGIGIFSDDLSERLDALVQDAITNAAATGSIGASSSIEYKGIKDTVRVERVAQHAAAWRVAHVSIADVPKYTHGLIGTVLVRKGLPGRYHNHVSI